MRQPREATSLRCVAGLLAPLAVAAVVAAEQGVGDQASQASSSASSSATPPQSSTSTPSQADGSSTQTSASPQPPTGPGAASTTPSSRLPEEGVPGSALPFEGVWPWESNRLTGEWFGVRPKLRDLGIDFEASLYVDWVANMRGGIETGSRFPYLWNLQLSLDLGKLASIPGGEVFVLGQIAEGNNPSANLVGDYQGVDNIAIFNGVSQVSQLWYRQTLLEGRLAAQVGKLDILFSFAAPSAGANFINNGLNYPATMNISLPTYPEPAFGVLVEGKPTDWLGLKAAIYDGSDPPAINALQSGTGGAGPATFFDNTAGYFVVGEANITWTLPGARAGTLALGGWGVTGEYPDFLGGIQKGMQGGYGYVEQAIWLADEKDPTGPGVTLWLMGSAAEQTANPASWALSGGSTWTGPIPGRPQDQAGLGAAYVNFSSTDPTRFPEGYELTLEAYYQLNLTSWLTIQPDLQYVINPGGGGLGATEDALVGILRMVVTF